MAMTDFLIEELQKLSRDDLMIVINTIMDKLNISAPEPKHSHTKMSAPVLDCPDCGPAGHVVRNGHKHHKQAYICRSCGRSFVTTTNTVLSGSHFGISIWKAVLSDTLSGISIDKTAERLEISHKSVFEMRHKIMLALENLEEDVPSVVEDVVEADETYVPDSYKGSKFGSTAPRAPRKRGTAASRRGLSNEKICICTAVQRGSSNLVIRSENRARPSAKNVDDIYRGHVKEGSLMLTDGMNCYPHLEELLNCTVTNVKKQNGSFYNLNTVNNLHSYIKARYVHYRGVATKYLNRYNNVFRMAFNRNVTIHELADRLFSTRKPEWVHHHHDIKQMKLLIV
jgi:transposase-like protein